MICCIRSLNRTDTRTGSLLQVICFSSPKYTGINNNNSKNTLLLCEQTHVYKALGSLTERLCNHAINVTLCLYSVPPS